VREFARRVSLAKLARMIYGAHALGSVMKPEENSNRFSSY
jgi:hypothetical protein